MTVWLGLLHLLSWELVSLSLKVAVTVAFRSSLVITIKYLIKNQHINNQLNKLYSTIDKNYHKFFMAY